MAKTIWICGLPSSGKSTIATMLYNTMDNVELLDGDVIRKNLSTLGFTKNDRLDNIKRIRWLCCLLNKNGIDVIVAVITPYEEMRAENRRQIKNYIEIWAKSSIEECIKRDVKGLYKKAQAGTMDKEQIKKAIDSFEADNFVDSREILQKEIQSTRDAYIQDKLGLRDEPDIDDKEE